MDDTQPAAPQRPPARDAQLNVYNVAAMLREPPDRFEVLRFDPNNDCNVQCVYCHNHRTKDLVSREDLLAFLRQHVVEVSTFQVGCVMEPTLDSRLGDLLLDIASSPAKPTQAFTLQTNGILLHMHDVSKLAASGLTRVLVSIDSADAAVQKDLRGGTSLAKVARNVEQVLKGCPELKAHFITTVTSANLGGMTQLVAFGLELGVSHFSMREIFYYPDNDVVDHARMPRLTLGTGEFATMAGALRDTFAEKATFDFLDSAMLAQSDLKMLDNSLRSRPAGAGAAKESETSPESDSDLKSTAIR